MVERQPNQPIILPADVRGSWDAMLAIYDQLEKSNRFFDWESTTDYSRHKALKSKPMALLLKQLSRLPLRESFRVGAGLFGVGILLPFDETRQMWDSRMVALHVTLDRQIEISLLDVSVQGMTRPVLQSRVCDLEDAAEQVVIFANMLPGTRVPAPRE